MTRIRTIIVMVVVASALFHADKASAQSEADRLRDALRQMTAQVRSLEDQRTGMQAQIAELTRSRDRFRDEVKEARAQARKSEADYRTAVREFNDRLEERNQTLERWKDAYNEAATVARTKDAERAKFEGESKAYKASTLACAGKNKELVKAGQELLQRYRSVTIGDAFIASEPVTGIGRVGVQNELQDYGDRVLNQKFEN